MKGYCAHGCTDFELRPTGIDRSPFERVPSAPVHRERLTTAQERFDTIQPGTDMKNLTISLGTFLALATLLAAPLRAAEEKIWHVKAVHPEGRLLDVKAIDPQGKLHAVKAFEADGNLHLLDIKALVDGRRLPVKILVSNDKYAPVKAIGEDGAILAIKALTPEGEKLDVKGVSRSGSIIHIKAIGPQGVFYGVKAISPEGRMYDVKGIKMFKERVETKVNGVEVEAHIKALPPAPESLK